MKLPQIAGRRGVKEKCQRCIVFLLPIVNIHAAWNFPVRIRTWDRDYPKLLEHVVDQPANAAATAVRKSPAGSGAGGMTFSPNDTIPG